VTRTFTDFEVLPPRVKISGDDASYLVFVFRSCGQSQKGFESVYLLFQGLILKDFQLIGGIEVGEILACFV
jgi:hypothetical protein